MIDLIVPSLNAGLEKYELSKDSEAYKVREEFLKDLYRKCGNNRDMYHVYDEMHGLKRKERPAMTGNRFAAIREYADTMTDRWNVRCAGEDWRCNWWTVSAEYADMNAPWESDLAWIKVYVSLKDMSQIADVFVDAVKLLLEKSEKRIYAKVAAYKREDCMCFWVYRQAFDLLEKHFASNDNIIGGVLPFVPYRGKLGISRELALFSSYSGELANLISHYFETVSSAEEVDMAQMFSLLVDAWNHRLPADHPIQRTFNFSDAELILLMVDSMDVITGKTALTDDHLLMQDNGPLWSALGESRNWDQVEEHYKTALERAKIRQEAYESKQKARAEAAKDK